MECPLPLTPEKRERKAVTKPSPKLHNLGHNRRCEQIHHVPDIEERSGGEALQDAASPGAYCQSCGHEGPKMQINLPGNGRWHAAEIRVHGREKIRHPANDKPAK